MPAGVAHAVASWDWQPLAGHVSEGVGCHACHSCPSCPRCSPPLQSCRSCECLLPSAERRWCIGAFTRLGMPRASTSCCCGGCGRGSALTSSPRAQRAASRVRRPQPHAATPTHLSSHMSTSAGGSAGPGAAAAAQSAHTGRSWARLGVAQVCVCSLLHCYCRHSLGGALATLAAYCICKLFPRKPAGRHGAASCAGIGCCYALRRLLSPCCLAHRAGDLVSVKVYTFGSPRCVALPG